MRIYGSNGVVTNSNSTGARRNGASTFALPGEAVAASENRATAAPRATGGIDALLAMQGVNNDPAERRRRSVARGRTALDVLDELKIGLLSGSLDNATVSRLRLVANDLKLSSGEAGLDAVLAEIELRVEVELAKAARI